ncbi:hypothetical protein FA95DRAFT_1634863 [Auriscalpium vulgare]|uniref:Uncharacterized protein n=1 Tax=Auriscalpium vulgare TaxID=40419 RepID=A0ACB8RFZ5_9AGAM|nr:hypothetical protein FA95DRAFT_1634863 [Auriscalpium vulgare]
MDLPEPPTSASLAAARSDLDESNRSLSDVQKRIEAAEAQLAQILAESRCAISELQRERAALEDKVARTRAYISPIRRLPSELLRLIFSLNFDEYPCCAWILAAIRLVTSPNASADTIRLWLERSGSRIPLDIEIFLQVQAPGASATTSRPRARSPSPWPYLSNPPTATTHYVQIPGAVPPSTSIQIIPTANPTIVLPPSPPHHDVIFGSPPPVSASLPAMTPPSQSRASSHWGHIAIFYLVEQMHRWERFVFRFDKQFASWHALKSISGPAPLLKEFEVSCAEPVYYGEWPWLPSASPNTQVVLPELKSLTLQYTPFKWSSPMLKMNLRSLNLRSLPTTNIPVDRILHIISNNRGLEELSLHFSNVLNYVLPLAPTTLPDLKDLSIGGHYYMASLVDSLIIPALESLTLDIEARDPIEDSITNLLSRSNHPPVSLLSIAYGNGGLPYYYSGAGLVASWGFLNELTLLRTLQVGSTPLDPLFSMLGAPEEDVPGWLCPNLEHLALRSCPSHSEGILKLVQMVEMRNPEGGSPATSAGTVPVKLRQLEMYDCSTLGQDVVAWLKTRIDDVVCVEPAFDRCDVSVICHWP